jgi:NADPH2:quinone reductase
MKAILVAENKDLVWAKVAMPKLKADEVLIKIHFAAVNRADLMQREGNYPPPPGSPKWMGLEVSGEVVEVGSEVGNEGLSRIGNRVCALLGGGGYAEYVAVRADQLMPIPKNCSLVEAAAIPEAFATAYLNLFVEGKAKAKDTLLMHAGASGLASVVIPMAKAFGMRVITSVLSKKIAKSISHLKADLIVNTAIENIVEVLKEEFEDGRPVDIAIDCLGGEKMGACLPFMSHGGRWIMIATLAGAVTEIDLKNVFVRNIRIIGSTLRSRTPEFKAQLLASIVREVYPKIEEGLVKPTIYKVLPITEAEAAQQLLAQGESVGKVVLEVRS